MLFAKLGRAFGLVQRAAGLEQLLRRDGKRGGGHLQPGDPGGEETVPRALWNRGITSEYLVCAVLLCRTFAVVDTKTVPVFKKSHMLLKKVELHCAISSSRKILSDCQAFRMFPRRSCRYILDRLNPLLEDLVTAAERSASEPRSMPTRT